MNLISTTLIHKIRPPSTTGSEKPPVLVLLHGRGTNEDDLLGLVEYLDPRFFVISARAPFRFQDESGGYTWYDLREVGSPVLQQFDASYLKLIQFLADMKAGYPVDGERMFLLGFSMGSVVSFAAALTAPVTAPVALATWASASEGTAIKAATNMRLCVEYFFMTGYSYG